MAIPPGATRQVGVTDAMYTVFKTMADESGQRIETLVSQAMFEMAVRLGYVTPVAADAAPPAGADKFEIEEGEPERPAARAPAAKPAAAGAPPPPKFAPGRTREAGAGQRKTEPPPPKPAAAPPAPPARPAAARPAPASARPPAARPAEEGAGLFIVNEDGDNEKIDKDIFIIGRSSKCDLVINSVKVSREHAIITRERGEYFIEDLGSANGTWYKGERIEKMKIHDSDEIFICDEKFKFIIR